MSHLYIDIEDQFSRRRNLREPKTSKDSHNRRPPCLVWEFSFKLAVQTDVYLTAHLIGAPETVVVCDWLIYPSHCTCGNLAAISKLIWVGQGEQNFSWHYLEENRDKVRVSFQLENCRPQSNDVKVEESYYFIFTA